MFARPGQTDPCQKFYQTYNQSLLAMWWHGPCPGEIFKSLAFSVTSITYKSNRAMNSQCWKICNANPPTSDIVYSLLSGIERKEKWNYEAKCILETNLNSESFLFYCFFRNSPALPPAEKESHSLHLTKLLPVVNLGIRRFQQEWTYFQSVFNTSPILTFCDILGMLSYKLMSFTTLALSRVRPFSKLGFRKLNWEMNKLNWRLWI